MSNYTQGMTADGPVIIRDGRPLGIGDILQALKDEKRRGYSQGYAAGQKRQDAMIDDEAVRKAKADAWLRIYSGVIGAALQSESWTQNGQKLDGLTGKSTLAAKFADEGVKRLVAEFGVRAIL